MQRLYYVVTHVPVLLWVQVYFTVCFKAEKQDYRELSMETKFRGQ